jgi:hypothetical protein
VAHRPVRITEVVVQKDFISPAAYDTMYPARSLKKYGAVLAGNVRLAAGRATWSFLAPAE